MTKFEAKKSKID